jgi:methionine-rich copper-binding protein CopC
MDRPIGFAQAQERRVMLRRLAITVLLALSAAAVRAQQAADDVRVLESTPAANAHIGRKSSAFFVRFDRPVDHRKSTLVIKQGDKVIERLHPRLESAPEVLFAAAPTLPPGDYKLHWAVITLQGTKAIEGDIPFKVSDQ